MPGARVQQRLGNKQAINPAWHLAMGREGWDTAIPRGIALLDAGGPKAWRRRIDLEELTMGDHTRCVLGQVFGSFDEGVWKLFKRGPIPAGAGRRLSVDTPGVIVTENGYDVDIYYYAFDTPWNEPLPIGNPRVLTNRWRKALR